jgi:hypothetical protein
MATANTETQPYKVWLSKDNFELRFYPTVIMATITSSAKSYKELGKLKTRIL